MKIFAPIVLVLFMLSACGQKDLTDIDYIRNAKELQQQNKLEASVIQLKNAIKFNPENSEARWLLGGIYSDLAKWESSEKELKTALRLGVSEAAIYPTLSQVLLNQGKYQQIIDQIQLKEDFSPELLVELYSVKTEAYLGKNDKNSAKENLKKAFAINPDSQRALLAQVNLNIYDKAYKQASDLLDKIVKEKPDSYKAWLLKGMVDGKLGKADKADKSYSLVIENSKGLALTAYLHRSLLLVKEGEYERARSDLKVIENISPKHPRYLFTKGLLALKTKRFIDARTNFENALKYSPDSLEISLFLGGVYYELGNLELAEKSLNKVVVKNPENIYARKLLAKILVSANKLVRAKQVIRPVLDDMPEDPSVALMYGKILMGLGEMDKALPPLQKAFMLQWDDHGRSNYIGAVSEQATLESMIGQYPENIQSQILLILAYQKVNKLAEATIEVDKFINAYPQSALPYTLKGMVLVMQNHQGEAKPLFETALKHNNFDPLASLHYGKLLSSQGKYEQAEIVFNECLAKFHNHPLILPQIANIAAKSGRLELARGYLDKWVKNSPDSLEARLALANFLLQSRQPFKALEILRKPPQLDLDNIFALKFLGDIYMAINAPSSAVSSYGKIVGAQPESPIGNYLLAKAYERFGDSEKAKINLKKALQIDSNHTPSRLSLAHFHISEGKLDKADEIISKIDEVSNSNNADYLVLIGRYNLAKGNHELALGKYQKALDVSNSPKAVVQLAKAHYTIDQIDEGIGVLREWLENNPENIHVRYIFADSLMQSGKKEGAAKQYKIILKNEPSHILALNNLAFLEMETSLDMALEYAQKAYLLASEQPEIIDTYGSALFRAGQLDLALEKLRKAYKKKPRGIEISLHYAQVLVAKGNEERAREVLTNILNNVEIENVKNKQSLVLKEINDLLVKINK